MQSDLETLIRDVLTEQAARAPHRATVLAGLRWGGRRRDWRLAVAAAGVAVALAAVGVPVAVHLTAHPASTETPATSTPSTPPPDIRIPYQPTWLPPGFVASMRVSKPALDEQMTAWEPKGQHKSGPDPSATGPAIQLDCIRFDPNKPPPAIDPSGQPVTVNGRTGTLVHENTTPPGGPHLDVSAVSWQPDAGYALILSVVNVPDPTGVALRVAKSMVAGQPDGVPQPLVYGYLPAGYHDDNLVVAGTSPTAWLVTRLAGDDNGGSVSATWSDIRPALTGQTTTIARGRSAFAGLWSRNWRALSVDVGGRWLTLEARASDLSTAELARIADGITVFPNVSLEWLGR